MSNCSGHARAAIAQAEGVGKATDDEQLEAEGKTDQAGEKVKDAFTMTR